MTTVIIGEQSQFALEYDIKESEPPYGSVRMWVNGSWLGDIQRSMHLYHMGSVLASMVSRDNSTLPCIYAKNDDILVDDALLETTSWSWGDSFDDFLFRMYVVEDTCAIHIVWKINSLSQSIANEYPRGLHRGVISFDTFDKVVSRFISEIKLK